MSVLDMFRLDGRIALVTGGASGIGYAYASAVAEAGANVCIADVNGEAAQAAADKLAGLTGREVMAIQADVSQAADNARMMAETVARFGRLDICFANAGIVDRGGMITEYDKEVWDRIIDVNLTGIFLTNQAAARVMAEQRSGSIINTASIFGHAGDPGFGNFAYTAAKGGVVQLTKSLAAQLAPLGIRVNAITPGFIKTSISKLHDENLTDPELIAKRNKFIQKTLLGHEGRPEHLKGIALFLASDASAFCTGYAYAADGGYLAT